MTPYEDSLDELLSTTSAIVVAALDLQREIMRGAADDGDSILDPREKVEDLWRELQQLLIDRFREERKDTPFPENPESARLTTPFPPTLNHNVARRGNCYYRDKNYDAFIELVGYEWKRVRPRKWNVERRYAVSISLFYDSKRRYDVDNRVKPVLDALTKAGVWNDDSQVDMIRVQRREIDKKNPRAEVVVAPIE